MAGRNSSDSVQKDHQLRSGFFFAELPRRSLDFFRHPIGKWSDLQLVLARRRVHFFQGCKPLLGKSSGHRNEGGPHPPVDVGDFSILQTAHQHVRRASNRSRELEYLTPLWMSPPTAPHRSSCDHLSETW